MRQLKNQDKTTALAEEKIPRLVLQFASTTFAALLFNSIYTLTDALFVSWGVGDNAMGGLSVVFPFVILQGAVSSAVGSGAASIVSRLLGHGERQQAGNVTFNAMLLFYGTALLTTVLGFVFMQPLLRLMGVTDDLLQASVQYFSIILAGNVFSTGFSSIIRAEGKMVYGLLIWVIPISINILLDALFILVLHWGVVGSAAATVACQFISFCMSVLFFTRLSVLDFSKRVCSPKLMGEILTVGLPSLIQMGGLSLMSGLMNRMLSTAAGTNGVNTFAYISKLAAFATVPFTAICQAAAPIVGYNYGADHMQRVREALRFSLGICLLYAILVFGLIQIMPEAFIRLFTDSEIIVQMGGKALRIIACSLPFTPISMLMGAYFQALGDKKRAFFLYAAAPVLLLPTVVLLEKAGGLHGVWWSYVLSNALAAFVSVFVFYFTNQSGRNKKAHNGLSI